MRLKSAALALAVLLGVRTASAQEPRLTPEVARDVLRLAHEARSLTPNRPVEAARAFRLSLFRAYQPGSPCTGRLEDRDTTPNVRACVFGPISWYAEQLATLLHQGQDLAAAGRVDAMVVVLVPVGTRREAPATFRISAQVPNENPNDVSREEMVPATGKTETWLQTVDGEGNPVLRSVTALLFEGPSLDTSRQYRVRWDLDGQVHYWLLSSSVLKVIR